MSRANLVAGAIIAAVVGTTMPIPSPAADEHRGQVIEEIVVVAPRVTRKQEDRAGPVQILLVERDERVDITDLDLTRTANVMELEKRVEAAAKLICEELTQEYPFGQPSTSVCVRRAVDDAMIEVREAVLEAIDR